MQALTVAYEVVNQLKVKELEAVEDHSLSCHREFHTAARSVPQPTHNHASHAIIRVDNVTECECVCEALNEYLSRHRDMYPREDGWHAACAHGGSASYPPTPLDSSHPWFYAKQHKGRVNRRASRILVAIDLATEGINNKYVTVIGFGSPIQALRSVIQSIGRAIRSTREVSRLDGLTVHTTPVAALDNICVDTHARFRSNRKIIESALHFMDDMESGLRDIPDLDTFFATQADIGRMVNGSRGGQLHIAGRIAALELACIAYCEGGRLTDRLKSRVCRGVCATTEPRKEIVDGILETVWSSNRARVGQLARELHITGVLPQQSLQLRETCTFTRTEEQLRRFAIGLWGEDWWRTLVTQMGSEQSLQLAHTSMRAITPRAGMYELEQDMRLDQVLEAIRGEALAAGFREVVPSQHRNRVEQSLKTAFTLVTGDANCFNSAEFNHHSVIYTFTTNARLRSRILGYVAFELAQAGILPGMQMALTL